MPDDLQTFARDHSSIVSTLMMLTALSLHAATKGVQVTPDPSSRRVDIAIDGKPFTSYIWPDTLKKPVLYPILDSDGVTITRGWPLAPRPGERTDHPHHDGLWFNYSNVNGFDFWNNSTAIPADRAPKMGTIVFDKIVSSKSGANRGELVTQSTWITGAGDKIIAETSHYVFGRQGSARSIDLIVTFNALDKVVFHDDKDGLLGLRVARWLESPEEKGGTFTDSNGVATQVAAVANLPGVAPPTGEYLTSEGIKGEAAWATRARWCSLTGHNGDGHTDTIAIFDRPGNPNYPTYWHARGYGLFAVNPLGQHMFDAKQPQLDYTLERGQSVTFRYRVVIYPRVVTSEELNKEADAFAREGKVAGLAGLAELAANTFSNSVPCPIHSPFSWRMGGKARTRGLVNSPSSANPGQTHLKGYMQSEVVGMGWGHGESPEVFC